jgi:hypothetical protein
MLVGNPETIAIESGITQPFPSLSKRALGHFVLHVGNRTYGVQHPTASLLACSFDEVGRRLKRRNLHLAAFSLESASEIVRAVVKVLYQGHDTAERFFSMSGEAFSASLSFAEIVWAPDGDAAFDDGGNVLHFDIQGDVRLVAFKNKPDLADTLLSISDVRLSSSEFYDVLDEWYKRFETEWSGAINSLSNH